jgi:ubiquitin carboxyl-terminal hydrolase 12/46
MGNTDTKLERELGPHTAENERYLGLENYGNTCYCNSVLQALYYCAAFRTALLHYVEQRHGAASGGGVDSLLIQLAQLYAQIGAHKRRTGVIGPRKFIQRLKTENVLFSGFNQQDAHEFLIYLLNAISENMERDARKEQKEDSKDPIKTLVHEYFEGVLTNETKCMMCETITSKDESFMDLSVDVEQNSSLTACLNNFSRIETLSRQNKFWCEQCHSLQEAQKRLRIKSPPRVLVVQLKRFKFLEEIERYTKLNYRVAFPLDLKQSGVHYRLGAVIIHLGAGPNQGHYIAVVRTAAHWLLFDDEHVHKMEESQLSSIFGSPYESSSQTGYILFYERHDEHVIDATAFNCAPILESLGDQRPVDIPVLTPGTRARDPAKGGLLDSVRDDYLRSNSPQKNSQSEISRSGSLLASKAN